jgi:hypothetical protein
MYSSEQLSFLGHLSLWQQPMMMNWTLQERQKS